MGALEVTIAVVAAFAIAGLIWIVVRDWRDRR